MLNKSSDNLQLTSYPDSKHQASLSNHERSSESITTIKSHAMQQRSCPGKELAGQNRRESLHTDPDAGVPTSDSDQENFIVALQPEKGLDKLPLKCNPDSVIRASPSDQGFIFSSLPEKPAVDGYNWRKYGQKLVRGKTLVRSYYKCTTANCPARKQVEHSHEGHIAEINYLLKHEHPESPRALVNRSAVVYPMHAIGSDEPYEDRSRMHPATSNDHEVQVTHLQSREVAISESSEMQSGVNYDISQDLKRQKKESSNVNDHIVTKTDCEPLIVVESRSAVDIVNDGYRWRKYGQKFVRGNPYPRSYYRCSSPGCPVKKHVERASYDEKVVITTYEGQHDHDMPSNGRTNTQNMAGNTNDGPKPKQETNESSGLEVIVDVSAN